MKWSWGRRWSWIRAFMFRSHLQSDSWISVSARCLMIVITLMFPSSDIAVGRINHGITYLGTSSLWQITTGNPVADHRAESKSLSKNESKNQGRQDIQAKVPEGQAEKQSQETEWGSNTRKLSEGTKSGRQMLWSWSKVVLGSFQLNRGFGIAAQWKAINVLTLNNDKQAAFCYNLNVSVLFQLLFLFISLSVWSCLLQLFIPTSCQFSCIHVPQSCLCPSVGSEPEHARVCV